MDVNTDIEAALEAAASEQETEESSTEEESKETVVESTSEEDSEKTETKAKGKGAQGRIQELIQANKDLETKLGELTGNVTARDEEISKLVDLLEMRENDARVVQRINELHASSPEFKDIIEDLDKAIRGEEIKPRTLSKGSEETGEDTKKAESVDEVLERAKKFVEESQQGLEQKLADQQADIILHKSDILADKYFEELAEKSYNEEDIRILRGVLVDHIDWNSIEDNPDDLNKLFAEGFQKCLDWYGTPKGAATAPKGDETKSEGRKEITQEDLDKYAGQDWGKLKAVKTADGETLQPEISDEDFTQSLARMLKEQNRMAG